MADEFTGSFTLTTPTGPFTVVLARQEGNRVIGTMTGGGATGTIDGVAEAGMFVGGMSFGGPHLFVRARRDGARLTFEMAEFDLQGQVAWGTARMLVFEAVAPAVSAPAAAAGPRNPFSRRAAEPAADPLAGGWTGEGVRLLLEGRDGRWRGRLEFAGEGFPIRVEGGPAEVRGVLCEGGQDFPFTGRIDGGMLVLRSAQGEFRLTRAGGAAPDAAAATGPGRNVSINDVRLRDDVLAALEQRMQVRVGDGEYWYDRACGAWGVKGGPMLGVIPALLDLGGPLAANASGGGTGVFVNGRELHPQDVAALQRLGPVMPGRYWLDARGTGGVEGGPALFNLAMLAQQAGGQGKAWSHHSKWGDMHVGGDGQGFTYYMDKDVSWSSGG